jgi:hypothetical protein
MPFSNMLESASAYPCPATFRMKNICLWAAMLADLSRYRISNLRLAETKSIWATPKGRRDSFQELPSHNAVSDQIRIRRYDGPIERSRTRNSQPECVGAAPFSHWAFTHRRHHIQVRRRAGTTIIITSAK